jgi:hypothetical protein
MMDEKKKFNNNNILYLFVLFALGVVIYGGMYFGGVFDSDSEYYKADCITSGCKEGYDCLSSTTEQICVKQKFHSDYWTIWNTYSTGTCKLTVVGNPVVGEIGETTLSFFAMTLKECDKLEASCSNSSRYNAMCNWDSANRDCRCLSQPYKDISLKPTASSNVTINIKSQ